MTKTDFVFSKKLNHRLARHLCFWAAYYLYLLAYNFGSTVLADITNIYVYTAAFTDWLCFLPASVLSVYFSLYFILPAYFKQKKVSFLITSILLLAIVTLVYCYFISAVFYFDSSSVILTETLLKWRGLPLVAGSAFIIKIMKDYLLRQQEAEILELKNVNDKLELLKKQMHLQTVFDQLHAIYLDLNAEKNHAPEMILQLSDFLSQSLYNNDLKDNSYYTTGDNSTLHQPE